MRTFRRHSTSLILPVALLFLVSGCVNLKPRPDLTRYFVLNTVAAIPSTGTTSENVILGIDRVSMASYLDTPEMATRIGTVEIDYNPVSRWGEDLAWAIPNRLAQRLRNSEGIRDVYTLPWPDQMKPSVRLELEINRFEGTAAGEAALDAVWILENTTQASRTRHYAAILIPGWTVGDYADLVSRLDLALDKLAAEIDASLLTVR
jgi:uncharacterized lipoprotein YmbA